MLLRDWSRRLSRHLLNKSYAKLKNNRDFFIHIFSHLKEFASFHYESLWATDDLDLSSDGSPEITLVLAFRHSIQNFSVVF